MFTTRPLTIQEKQSKSAVTHALVKTECGNAPMNLAWQPAQFMEMVITLLLMANASALVEIANTHWPRITVVKTVPALEPSELSLRTSPVEPLGPPAQRPLKSSYGTMNWYSVMESLK